MAMAHKSWGLEVVPEHIPAALKEFDRWVCWRAKIKPDGGKPGKEPIRTSGRLANTRKPSTWTSFGDALDAYRENPGWSGIGIVLTGFEKPLTVLDLDRCYDPIDGPEPWAQEIIDAADSYTEVSPSERGVRIFLVQDVGAFTNNERGLEVYTGQSTRFVTVTGRTLPGHDKMRPVTQDLRDVLERYRPDVREYREDPIEESPAEIVSFTTELCRRDSEMAGYDNWLQLGMALHHQFRGDPDGLDIWHAASGELPNYDPDELDKKWDGFGQREGGREVTLRTFIDRASDHGIKVRHQSAPATADDFPDLDGDEEDFPDVQDEAEPDTLAVPTINDISLDAPPPQLIEDMITTRSMVQISGMPKAGKTFFAMEMARCVASGLKFGNLKTKPGPVLYLAYEGLAAVAKRARAWKAVGNPMPDNLYVLGTRHGMPYLTNESKEWTDWLLPYFKAVKPRMIVIDTLSAAAPTLDMNNEVDVKRLMSSLRNVAEKTGCAMVHIHHPPKSAAVTGLKSRGSGAIEGDLDTQLWVTRSEGGARLAEVSLQRDLEDDHEFRFKVSSVATGQMTDFGEERGGYLSWDVTQDDSYSEDVLELVEAVKQAIRDHGNTRIEGGTYLGIMDQWIADNWPDAGEESIRKHRKRGLRHLRREFKVTNRGKSSMVECVELGGT